MDIGALTLDGDTTLATNSGAAAGANLNIGAVTGSGMGLTLNAGTGGAITGSSDIGINAARLDNLTITNCSTASISGTVYLGGDLTLSGGTLSGTNNFNVYGGAATGNGAIALTGGTFLLGGTGNLGGDASWSFNNLTIGDLTVGTTTKAGSGNITVSGALKVDTNQVLDAGDDTWTLSGIGAPLALNGTLTPNASTFKFTGAAATNITPAAYYNLTLDKAGTTFTAGGDINTDNNFTVTNGTFACGANTLTVGGDFDIDGIFDAGTGKVVFNNIANVTHVYGTNFEDLEITTPGKEVQFGAGQTETINGDLTITGAAGLGNLVILRSTAGGTQWKIDPKGARDVSYVDVKDSNNINAVVIDPTNSTDGGNNTNWFPAPAPPPSPSGDVSKKIPESVLVLPIPQAVEKLIQDEPDSAQESAQADQSDDTIFRVPSVAELFSKKEYAPGRYITKTYTISGEVAVADYDEKGPQFEKSFILTAGKSLYSEGLVEAKETVRKKFRVEVNMPLDSEGELIISPAYPEKAGDKKPVILKPGSSFINTA